MKKRALLLMLLLLLNFSGCAPKETPPSHLPVLLYHHITEEMDETDSVTVQQFEAQMAMLNNQGYRPISLRQLSEYAEKGTELPKNPVLITFDDGYFSNYQLAYPILKKYQYPATIFAIGCSIGKSTYKDTSHSITPHFGEAEIREMVESGLISIQSHTWDLHQWPPFEGEGPLRENVLPLPGETEEAYRAALTADHQKAVEVLRAMGADATVAVAYPHGQSTPLSDRILQDLGVKITFTTDEIKVNTLRAKDPETLLGLGRFSVGRGTTETALLNYLKK